MQMKRFAALASAAVICLSFAACGSADTEESSSSVTVSSNSSDGSFDAAAAYAIDAADVPDGFDYNQYCLDFAKQIFQKASGYYDAVGFPEDGTYMEKSEGELYKAIKDMCEYPAWFEVIVQDGELNNTTFTMKNKEGKLITGKWTINVDELISDQDISSAEESSIAEKVIEDYQAYCDEWCRQVLGMAQCIINGVGMGDGVPIPDGVYKNGGDSSVNEYIECMLEPEGDYVVTIENGVAVTAELTIHDKDGNEYHSVYSIK